VSERRPLVFLLALLAGVAMLVVAGCGDDDSDSGSGSATTGTVSLDDCTPDSLETLSSGTLTVATDSPAFPPYFEDDDPTNGQGFESAVAYAIADKLGYAESDVEWVVEPFNSSYRPGPKDFDFDVNQISITPKRAEAVDFSSPYYTADQALVALRGSGFENATSLADFADASIGVQIGTTSLEAVEASIQPSSEPRVFDTSNDVVSALKQGQVDAVVVGQALDVDRVELRHQPTPQLVAALEILEAHRGQPVVTVAAEVGDVGAVQQPGRPGEDLLGAAVVDPQPGAAPRGRDATRVQGHP